MSVRSSVNPPNHKFKSELILAMFNMIEKNQKRWDKVKEKITKSNTN